MLLLSYMMLSQIRKSTIIGIPIVCKAQRLNYASNTDHPFNHLPLVGVLASDMVVYHTLKATH